MAVFSYLPNLESGLVTSFWWTSFWCIFSAWFFHKNVLFNTPSMDKVSMLYLIY